jgi:hypothetical protein
MIKLNKRESNFGLFLLVPFLLLFTACFCEKSSFVFFRTESRSFRIGVNRRIPGKNKIQIFPTLRSLVTSSFLFFSFLFFVSDTLYFLLLLLPLLPPIQFLQSDSLVAFCLLPLLCLVFFPFIRSQVKSFCIHQPYFQSYFQS